MGSKRKLICRKARVAKRINVIFDSIDWLLFLGFAILAAHFMIGVIDQYQEKTTSFSQSLRPITKMPTILICIEGDPISNYKEDVKLGYSAEVREWIHKDNIKENETYVFKDANETFQVYQVQDKCVMIESNLTSPYKHGRRWIVLKFEKKMTKVHFYFTSKANSIGSVFQQWWDGQVLDIVVEAGYVARASIQSSEKRYLNFGNQCSYVSHLDKWVSTNPQEKFLKDEKWKTKCSPSTFFSHLLPVCEWHQQQNIIKSITKFVWYLREFTADYGYKRPCNIMEYQGYKTHEEKKGNNKTVTLKYSFAPPFLTSVQQEYLIFDITGMIGSVGGTLGMCIGFSFSGVTTTILEFIKARILNYF